MLTILSYDHGAAIREIAAFDRDMVDVLQKMQVQAQAQVQIQPTRNKRRAVEIEEDESTVSSRPMQRCKVSRTQVAVTTD
ncbi:hypothetical protein GQ42DRAFT_160837 [Ramicandelaber brevisporus]|nr:hypothetical protein GQ42DRAFT_160837 [Ramicandelaber brevisporus]